MVAIIMMLAGLSAIAMEEVLLVAEAAAVRVVAVVEVVVKHQALGRAQQNCFYITSYSKAISAKYIHTNPKPVHFIKLLSFSES